MSIKLRACSAALLIGLVGVTACGDDEEDGSGGSGSGASGSSSSSSSSGSGASGPSSSSSSSSSSGGGGEGNVGGEGGSPQGGAGPGGDAQGGAGGGLGGGDQGGAGQGGGGGGNNNATCATPIAVVNPQTVTGNTTGAAALQEPNGCATTGAGNAPEMVYELTPTTTGPLDITLTSTFDAVLYVRTTCDTATSEIDCNDSSFTVETTTIDVTTGEKVYLIVDGFDDADFGTFTLEIDPQEACADAVDNDGDDLIDCEDPDCDGNAACNLAATCAAAPALAATQTGDTSTGTDDFIGGDETFCDIGGDLAKESLYSYAATQTGVLKLTLQSATDQGLYVRTDCDGFASRAACEENTAAGTDEVRWVGAVSGQTLTVFVDGDFSGEEGPFTLLSSFTPVTLTEAEPNDTSAQANTYAAGYVGMHPAGDADWVKVTVPGPMSSITAETVDAPGVSGACLATDVDSFLDIVGTDGTTVLDSDDDDGEGWCSLASATNLAAGTYFVVVYSDFSPNDQFAYQLNVTVTP